jgi:hypothetical protein
MKRILLTTLASVATLAFANAQVVNSTEISIGSDAIITSDMDFLNTSTGKVENDGTLMLQRNMKNDGSFQAKGKVVLNGSNKQLLNGQKAIEVGTVEFSNAGTVLNTQLRVESLAQFNSGIVQTEEKMPMTFGEKAVASNASDASHVDGFVTSTKGQNFTFPIGDGSQLKAFTVDKSENFTAHYKSVSPMYVSTAKSEDVDAMNESEYWVLKSSGRALSTKLSVPAGFDSEAIVALNKGTWEIADENAKKSSNVLSSHMPISTTEQLFTVGKGRKVQAGIGIYPNPTHGDFNLMFKGIDDNEHVKVNITLQSGVSIMELEGRAGDLKKQYTLPEDLGSQGLLLKMTRTKKNQNFVERIVFDK